MANRGELMLQAIRAAELGKQATAMAFMDALCRDVELTARADERAKLAEALDGGEYECPEHGNTKHGREAEELRSGLEELEKEYTAEGGEWVDAADVAHKLRTLLDEVDARDSLAFLERHDEGLERLVRAKVADELEKLADLNTVGGFELMHNDVRRLIARLRGVT